MYIEFYAKDIERLTPQRIKEIRKSYGFTQEQFADLLNISYHTYKNWEIGHRYPSSPAMALLNVADKHPKIFLDTQKDFLQKLKALKITPK